MRRRDKEIKELAEMEKIPQYQKIGHRAKLAVVEIKINEMFEQQNKTL